jgi:hypothetical protein
MLAPYKNVTSLLNVGVLLKCQRFIEMSVFYENVSTFLKMSAPYENVRAL